MIQNNCFQVGSGPLLNITDAVIAGEALPPSVAGELLALPPARIYDLMYAAHLVKRHFTGDALHRCAIVNAKSGGCGEDCGFCAQSAHFDTGADRYTLLEVDKILRAAQFAQGYGAENFGIVTALRAIPEGPMLDRICDAIRAIRARGGVLPDASLGTVSKRALIQLKDAGLEVYHHNLETAKSYYPKVTTTRVWDENRNTIVWAKEIGLKTCCGGIVGMGESHDQRVEFIYQLRDLHPDNVPLNFLVPIPGTPLANEGKLTPLECLSFVAVARLALPRQTIFIAGGRVQHLRQLQPMLFFAGANGMMVGNYLTTPGRTKKDDIEMLRDLDMISPDEVVRLATPVPVMSGTSASVASATAAHDHGKEAPAGAASCCS